MKVILQQDVKTLGKKGEVVEVNDGYARNYILPKKIGIEASGRNMNDLKLQKANEEKVAQENYEAALKFAEEIRGREIVVPIKAGEGGKTFGSVSGKEIAREALSQHGLSIDRKKIQLSEPIKTFGAFTVPVKLHPKVVGELTVKVVEG